MKTGADYYFDRTPPARARGLVRAFVRASEGVVEFLV